MTQVDVKMITGGRMRRLTYSKDEYVAKRDLLIPRAEAICDTSLKVVDKKDRGIAWTRLFSGPWTGCVWCSV